MGLIHGSFKLIWDIWGRFWIRQDIFQPAPGGVRPLSVELGHFGASSGWVWGLFQAAWGPFWGVWDKPQEFGANSGGCGANFGGFVANVAKWRLHVTAAISGWGLRDTRVSQMSHVSGSSVFWGIPSLALTRPLGQIPPILGHSSLSIWDLHKPTRNPPFFHYLTPFSPLFPHSRAVFHQNTTFCTHKPHTPPLCGKTTSVPINFIFLRCFLEI